MTFRNIFKKSSIIFMIALIKRMDNTMLYILKTQAFEYFP